MHIGIAGYNHESSAALVDNNGLLVDYAREESLSRLKEINLSPKGQSTKYLKVIISI